MATTKLGEKISKEVQEHILGRECVNVFSNLLFWGERYNDTLEKICSKFPNGFGSFIASLAVFILGITARGEWLLFGAYFIKYLQVGEENYIEETNVFIDSYQMWFSMRFKGFTHSLIVSTVVSYAAYFGIGGFLHWYYYVKQRANPETWKCQPNKWLSSEEERHEIMLGSISLVFGSTLGAAMSAYVLNGGWCQIYYIANEYGYFWLFLQVPVIFIYNDYLTYWHHRWYHTPWLYKNFHKLHHTYKQPTAFSVTAIHPVEFVHLQCVLMSPMFLFPIHWGCYSVILIYTYYHGIIDHSGINFKRYWWQPWQPDCIFHDNHHQYFHVNFGFNIEYWDKLHGTYRRKDRIYREDIFYGTGKSIEEASVEELKKDIEERESENPTAYSGNQRHFDLDREAVTQLLKSKS